MIKLKLIFFPVLAMTFSLGLILGGEGHVRLKAFGIDLEVHQLEQEVKGWETQNQIRVERKEYGE